MQAENNQPPKPGPLASVLSIFETTVGRKYIMGLSGLGLVGFIIMHLAGNLTIFFGEEALLAYAHKLESLGPLLYLIELGLLAVFVFHIVFALSVTAQNRGARNSRYAANGSAGNPSKKTAASLSMIISGVIIMAFTAWHIWMFRIQKEMVDKNLWELVVEAFKTPWISIVYMVVMIFLGAHLSHGFWSAFQSLGAHHKRYTPLIYAAGILIALVVAFGFLAIPPYIYFFVDAPAA